MRFSHLIESFDPARPPVETINELLEVTGYLDFLKSENTIESLGPCRECERVHYGCSQI